MHENESLEPRLASGAELNQTDNVRSSPQIAPATQQLALSEPSGTSSDSVDMATLPPDRRDVEGLDANLESRNPPAALTDAEALALYPVDVQEAASILGVSLARLSQLTSKGTLSHVRRRVGARWRIFYRRDELAEIARGQRAVVVPRSLLTHTAFLYDRTTGDARSFEVTSDRTVFAPLPCEPEVAAALPLAQRSAGSKIQAGESAARAGAASANVEVPNETHVDENDSLSAQSVFRHLPFFGSLKKQTGYGVNFVSAQGLEERAYDLCQMKAVQGELAALKRGVGGLERELAALALEMRRVGTAPAPALPLLPLRSASTAIAMQLRNESGNARSDLISARWPQRTSAREESRVSGVIPRKARAASGVRVSFKK